MDIDFNKIKEIYGFDVLNACKDNVNDLVKNINYLVKLDFDDVCDVVERFPFIFLDDHEHFKHKINKLIEKLGIDYIDILEENMGIWEELL